MPLKTFGVDFENAAKNKIYPTCIQKDKNENLFITGYYTTRTGVCLGFVAKTLKDERIAWLKTFRFGMKKNNAGVSIDVKDESCMVAFRSGDAAGWNNYIVRINHKGQEKFRTKLEITDMPRQVLFDEINEKVLVAFKGTEIENDFGVSENLNFQKYDIATKKAEWSCSMELKGNLADIVKTGEQFLLCGNFNRLKNESGEVISSQTTGGDNETNIFVARINEKGEIAKIETIKSIKPLFAMKAIKLDSERINILGLKSEVKKLRNIKYTRLIDLQYSIVDKTGKLLFTNTK